MDPLLTLFVVVGLLAALVTTHHSNPPSAARRRPSGIEPWSGTEPLVAWYWRNRGREVPPRPVWRPGRQD